VRREKRFTNNHAPNNRISPIGRFAPPPPTSRYSPICNLKSSLPPRARPSRGGDKPPLAETASCRHRLYRAHERPMPGCFGDIG